MFVLFWLRPACGGAKIKQSYSLPALGLSVGLALSNFLVIFQYIRVVCGLTRGLNQRLKYNPTGQDFVAVGAIFSFVICRHIDKSTKVSNRLATEIVVSAESICQKECQARSLLFFIPHACNCCVVLSQNRSCSFPIQIKCLPQLL